MLARENAYDRINEQIQEKQKFSEEATRLQQQVHFLQRTLASKNASFDQKCLEYDVLKRSMLREQEVLLKQDQLSKKEKEIAAKEKELDKKREEINAEKEELVKKGKEIAAKEEELTKKEKEINAEKEESNHQKKIVAVYQYLDSLNKKEQAIDVKQHDTNTKEKQQDANKKENQPSSKKIVEKKSNDDDDDDNDDSESYEYETDSEDEDDKKTVQLWKITLCRANIDRPNDDRFFLSKSAAEKFCDWLTSVDKKLRIAGEKKSYVFAKDLMQVQIEPDPQ